MAFSPASGIVEAGIGARDAAALECGGKRSATPLCATPTPYSADFTAGAKSKAGAIAAATCLPRSALPAAL